MASEPGSALSHEPSVLVTIVTDNFGGGTGRHLIEMLKHRDIGAWPTRILCYGVDDGLVPPATVPYRRRRYRSRFVRFPLPQLRVLWNLARALPRGRSVVHTYFFWPIIYGRILKRFGRVGLLVENREDLGFKLSGTHRWALRRLQGEPDAVICVSEAVRQAVIQNERLPPHKVVVIENGVPLPDRWGETRSETRRQLGIEPHHVLVGLVANLNRPVKAVERFVESVPLILARAPMTRFVVAGEGYLRPQLEDQAQRLGVAGSITFLGRVDEVGRLYDGFDLSVLTSRSEGLSITILESMARGLPVVVTAVGGNPEVVIDGETGYLVPPDDVGAFTEAVVGLVLDPAARRRMGIAARKRCEVHYDVRSVSSRYEAVYRSLMIRRKNHS